MIPHTEMTTPNSDSFGPQICILTNLPFFSIVHLNNVDGFVPRRLLLQSQDRTLTAFLRQIMRKSCDRFFFPLSLCSFAQYTLFSLQTIVCQIKLVTH